MSAKKVSKVKKKSETEKSLVFKAKLAQEVAALTSPPAEPKLEDSLSPQIKKWRQETLKEISQPIEAKAELAPQVSLGANKTAIPAELKERLHRRRAQKRRGWFLPILALIIYALVNILRLDVYLPAVTTYLPWPAAYLNGQIIWLDEVKRQSELLDRLPAPKAESAALDHLVEVQLIKDEFKRNQLALTDDLAQTQLANLASEFGSSQAFEDYLLATYGLKVAEFTKQVLLPYFRRLSLTQYLNQDPQALAKTESEALKLWQKIDSGELSFEQAAREYSDDVYSRDQGGDLGWFDWGAMRSEFELALLSLKPGEISKPVLSDYGWHLLRLDEVAGELPTNATTVEAAGSARASHIFFQIVNFTNWLAEQKQHSLLLRLVPLRS